MRDGRSRRSAQGDDGYRGTCGWIAIAKPSHATVDVDIDPSGSVPGMVVDLARALPRRSGPHDKTEGFLIADGRVIHDSLFAAEPDGRLRSRRLRAGKAPAAGAGLRLPTAKANVMDHVEAQAAAVLRRPGAPRTAILVLNNPPCDDPINPLMCEKLLPGIIPAGSAVTVYVTDAERVWQHRVYAGTGKEIVA